jgi:uncharacterized membrane protein (UPF0127 family)
MKKKSRLLFTRKKGILFLHHPSHARTRGERFMGLMGVSPASFTRPLIFHLEREGILEGSIHMLFMKMPIDVMWLDAQQGIVGWKKNLPAWSLNHSPPSPASFIIELPAGSLSRMVPKRGEKVKWD